MCIPMKLSLKPRTYLSPSNSFSCLFILPLTSVSRQLGTCFLPLKLCLYFIDCVSAQLFFFFVLLISLRKTFFFFLFKFIYLFIFICSEFCHTLKWNSHGFTCVPHPNPPSHLPFHPLPLGLPSAPGLSACLMHPTWAGDLFHPR